MESHTNRHDENEKSSHKYTKNNRKDKIKINDTIVDRKKGGDILPTEKKIIIDITKETAEINISKIKLNNGEEKNKRRTNSKSEKTTEIRPTVNRRSAGSNWLSALAQNSTDKFIDAGDGSKKPAKTTTNKHTKNNKNKSKIIAIDCEMVGTGPNGVEDMLARVSIVNQQGEVLLDEFVRPRETVTDYRTHISGIRPQDIENGKDFAIVQDEVVKLLQGKLLVGHSIRSDLSVLYIKHPYVNIRDTARYKPLSRLVSNGHTPSLKRLCKAILGTDIQTGEHNSIEDARAAMQIYNRFSKDWEKYIHRNKIGGKPKNYNNKQR